jgi:hypothetical protein
MSKEKSPVKSYEKSYTLVIAASLLIAVIMPFVRALAHNDGELRAAASYVSAAHAPVAATSTLAGGGSDEVSMVAVGAFLLGLGFVLRRVA